jgi:hypothetical protein
VDKINVAALLENFRRLVGQSLLSVQLRADHLAQVTELPPSHTLNTYITLVELFQALKKLQRNKVVGLDGMKVEIILDAGELLHMPPLTTFNYFLVAPLLWPSVGVKPNTWKSRELESSGTPECSELDSKAQNTSPWGVLGVIGKVSKCRCPKWPRIGHLDICSPSYGQKKGRESNWQFDSRPLKVGNRPVPDVRSGSATWR